MRGHHKANPLRKLRNAWIATVNDIAGKHQHESILIVSHGVSLAVIICHAQGFPLDEVYEHVPENAKPYRVKWK